MRTFTLLTLLSLIAAAQIACAAPDTGDELLPPGTQTDHLEEFRPQIHYTPAAGWMNDPNGLVWHDGTWNLYHQYIPGEFVIDRMNWGHAVSTDLIRWTYRPIALSTNPDLGMAYSGSALADPTNVSGLCTGDFSDCILAFFTHSLMLGGDQKQSLAASNDGGLTFTEYGDNPIMSNPGLANFRDPKVFLYDDALADMPLANDRTGAKATEGPAATEAPSATEGPAATHWNMVLAEGDSLGFYTSGNLIEWQPSGKLANNETWTGGVWECPDLFHMPVENAAGEWKWVLMISTFDGAPWDGSGVMYFTGSFDGQSFTPDDASLTPRWLDNGWDFYAAQSFADVPAADGRRIVIAWMNNWKYALGIPAMPWQGAMTIPRQVSLTKDIDGTYTLKQAPVDEFSLLNRGAVVDMPRLESSAYKTPLWSSGTGLYEIQVTGPRWDKWEIRIASMTDAMPVVDNAIVTIGIDNGVLTVDRTGAICPDCPGSMAAVRSVEMNTGTYGRSALTARAAAAVQADYYVTLRIIVDHSGVEIFADDGRTTVTAQAFLPGPRWDVSIDTPEATEQAPFVFNDVMVRELMSIWATPDASAP